MHGPRVAGMGLSHVGDGDLLSMVFFFHARVLCTTRPHHDNSTVSYPNPNQPRASIRRKKTYQDSELPIREG